MFSLGIEPTTELDLDTAGATVDSVVAALAAEAVVVRGGDVRVHGSSASTNERRALFELIAAGRARKGRTAVRLTRSGRSAARAEGVSLHARR